MAVSTKEQHALPDPGKAADQSYQSMFTRFCKDCMPCNADALCSVSKLANFL